MTRIVAGFAGSLSLTVPRSGTRPTSDRVREAVFSSLEARDALEHARVLDLFAGSGALGLEAASRGADFVVLVDSSRAAGDACRTNARAVLRAAHSGSGIDIDVVAQDARAYLARAGSDPFDLVFADPPYDLADDELARVLAALAPLLAPGATVVVERARASPEPTLPDALALERRTVYGDTALWWIRPH